MKHMVINGIRIRFRNEQEFLVALDALCSVLAA